MHRKVLALLLLLMYLAATSCGLPQTIRSSELRDAQLSAENRNKVTAKQESNVISPSDAPETSSSPKISNNSTDVPKEGSDDQQKHKSQNLDGNQQENSTTSGMDVTKEDYPQGQQSSSVQVSVEPSIEENLPKQQTDVHEPAPNEIQNISTQLLQDRFQKVREEPSKTNKQQRQHLSTSTSETEDETERQNQNKALTGASSNGHKDIHPILTTAERKQNKTIALRKHLPNVSQSQRYQTTSLKDYQENSSSDVKQQDQKTKQALKLVLTGGEKPAETSNNLQLLQSLKYNEQKQQSSSVVLSEPIHPISSTEEFDSVSSESPREAGLLDYDPRHSASPEHFVSSSNIKQETNTQEHYDPDLYARPQIAEDLVTTNNALDPKPSITTYSGFTPTFPVRTAIPQYAVREEHPDDLAPHHFAVAGHLPYALDRAKFIQYQVIVSPPIIVQAEDKELYPATKPFSFRVHHGTPTLSEDVQDDVGQRRSLSEGLAGHQRDQS